MAAGSALKPERRLTIGPARISVFAHKQDLFEAGANTFFATVREALERGGRCSIALAGGSTPKSLYSLVAKRAEKEEELRRIDWRKVHLFFGDERSVPPDHPDSNYGMALKTLLPNGLVAPGNVHRILAEKTAPVAADLYEQELKRFFSGPPQFDLILLGIGPDAHTASLFPGTDALLVSDRSVAANHIPKMNTDRITLTFPALNAARCVLFMAAGEDKKDAVANIFVRHEDLPAAKVRPMGELLWYLDREAATLLPA
jgi:6-phosphogluconolactonase